MQLPVLLLLPSLVIAGNSYFLTRERYNRLEPVCGQGNAVAMATHYNLSSLGALLRRHGVASAFVAGWNGDDSELLRVTSVAGQATVAPHDDKKAYHIICHGTEPTSGSSSSSSSSSSNSSSSSKSQSRSRSRSLSSRTTSTRSRSSSNRST